MTDLEALSEVSPPRPDRIAQRFARRIHPTFGFVLYGFLYFCIVANTVGILPLPLLISVAEKPAPSWLVYGWLVWYVLAQVGCWWLFRHWVQRKRADACAVVRNGEIVNASLSHTFKSGSRRFTVIGVGGATMLSPVHLGEGEHCKVLFLPGARWCFVFDLAGNAIPAATSGSNPVGPLRRESNTEPLPEARIVE